MSITESLLGMQDPRPQPTPPAPEHASSQDAQVARVQFGECWCRPVTAPSITPQPCWPSRKGREEHILVIEDESQVF